LNYFVRRNFFEARLRPKQIARLRAFFEHFCRHPFRGSRQHEANIALVLHEQGTSHSGRTRRKPFFDCFANLQVIAYRTTSRHGIRIVVRDDHRAVADIDHAVRKTRLVSQVQYLGLLRHGSSGKVESIAHYISMGSINVVKHGAIRVLGKTFAVRAELTVGQDAESVIIKCEQIQFRDRIRKANVLRAEHNRPATRHYLAIVDNCSRIRIADINERSKCVRCHIQRADFFLHANQEGIRTVGRKDETRTGRLHVGAVLLIPEADVNVASLGIHIGLYVHPGNRWTPFEHHRTRAFR